MKSRAREWSKSHSEATANPVAAALFIQSALPARVDEPTSTLWNTFTGPSPFR